MKRLTLLVVIVVCVLGAVAQSPRSKNEAPVTPVVRVTEPSNASATKTTAFTAAAASNATLRNELTWTFGGKQQRGWYLYDLLINKTLDSQNDTITNDFASTLASWQKKRGLSSDGVLNEDSLMAFVSQWQGNRLKDRTPATADQLLTAPSSDFYDPERTPELRQVERNTYEAYKRMMTAAAAELKLDPSDQYLKIVSAFRSREYQDELRRKSPNAGSAGLAVNSPHFTGRALDLYVGGSPVDTQDSNRAIQVNTPAYRWLVRNAERFGFRPYFYEPWHWEYVQ
ncbi:MAG TPA: D-alanyl-D-alanine carboxypeptidase family protein [Pyrinomonadaceae bacterium]|jgi:LAS superfamily LD-carboxypeptidase LdcB